MKKYTIKQDDCLSLIAERFDTSIEVLQSLNSDQIKNIDLLYTGDTLVLPGSVDEPLAITTGERIPLPTIPTALPIGTGACEPSKPDYVDILYVPSHPSSEKSVWYALTQEAVDAIKSEKDQLANAIVDNDKTQTLQNLNDLGVLSKFEAKAYDQFLGAKDASRYRELLFAQLTLKSGASSLYQHGENSFLFSLASNEGLDLSQLEQEALTWEKAKSNMLTSLSLSSGGMGASAIAFNEDIYDLFNNEEAVKKRIFRARAKVQKSLLDHLEDEIAKLEKKAIKQAKELESDDGTHFVFDKKNKFFTSAKEHDIDKKIKRLYKNRDYTDKEMALQSQADSAKDYTRFWESKVPYDIENRASFPDHYDHGKFARALISLNQFGYVVKEQCLTRAELVGEEAYHFGPKCLQTAEFEGWRETGYFSDDANPLKTSTDADGIVKKLYEDVKGETYADKDADEAGIKAILGEAQVAEWAYYPTLALIEVIDETIKKHLNDVKAILGVNKLTVPDFCKRLLWVKKVALGRKKALQKIAKERAQKRNVTLFQGKEDDAELTLIWNETKHLPQKKKLGKMTRTAFKNEAGYADIQIVECSLLSEGEVFYVRGPAWYMPTKTADELKCLKHVKDITGKLGFASTSSDAGAVGKNFKDALAEIKKPSMSYLNLSGEAIIKKSLFWSDAFHWQGGVGPNGNEAAYSASAQSQFFRFTSSAAANFNTPINDLSNITNQIGVDTNIGAKLNLFNAQLSFSTWLPLKSGNENIQETSPKDVTGYSVEIPYQNDFGCAVYDAGELCVRLAASVYGLAAASCQLSAGLAFGPSDNEGIGIRGAAFKAADYNQYADMNALADTGLEMKGTAEAKAKVDVFAGVEVGGTLAAEIHWRPPAAYNKSASNLLQLGEVSSQFAVSYGAGASAEFKLCFQNGFLILIAGAKAVCGPGASGKVAIKLNPINADRFIMCLLGVLRQEGFKYVTIFGDRDEKGVNKDFEELNSLLTVALAMGLSLCDVLLLPTVTYAKYKKDSLQEEYAPLMASNFLEDSNQDSYRKWVTHLPPETLGNLFACLINDQEYSIYDRIEDIGNQVQETRIETIESNYNKNQAKVIVKIFNWLANVKDIENAKAQFEKTLFYMNVHDENIRTPAKQWENYYVNWCKIKGFVKRFASGADDESKTLRNMFNIASQKLCGNMRAASYESLEAKGNGNHGTIVKKLNYLAYHEGATQNSEALEAKALIEEQIKTMKGVKENWTL